MSGRTVSPVVPRLVTRLVPRLLNVRERMRAAAVDALVISHLPNIRYLTGFVGTAGQVVLTTAAALPSAAHPDAVLRVDAGTVLA